MYISILKIQLFSCIAFTYFIFFLIFPHFLQMKRRSASAVTTDPKNLRRSVFVEGVRAQANLSNGTYRWDQLLEEVRHFDSTTTNRVLPVSAFGNPALGEFFKVMPTSGLRLEIRHDDYRQQIPDKQIYWIAEVKKLVGFYLLMRFEGMDEEGDERDDFWVNIGSDDVKHVGYCSETTNCELLPPRRIGGRRTDWREYIMAKLDACKTLTSRWVRERQLSLVEGKFKIGTRLELLDRLVSSRVRPARVIEQLGRRICLQISQEDVDKEHWAEAKRRDDAQVRTGIWCDESHELIFPVGWALANGYGLVANAEYVAHCAKIVHALQRGEQSQYDEWDASPDIFNEWKENVAEDSNGGGTIHWQVGMKFECLDPLNQSFLELKVATCLALLKDGYLRVGFDGPDIEEDAMPIHCTSPFLFPVNYATEHGIALSGPKETEREFSWPEYLRQCQASAAPNVLFDNIPPTVQLEQFKVSSKLEATDQCESNLVCPATICAVRGRLLQVHFDGWENEMDQLFDYRLEAPKGYDLSKKRKRTMDE